MIQKKVGISADSGGATGTLDFLSDNSQISRSICKPRILELTYGF